MKLALFVIIGLVFLLCGLSPQLRTHYTPLPAIARVKRRAWGYQWRVWTYQRPRWAIAVMVVRIA